MLAEWLGQYGNKASADGIICQAAEFGYTWLGQ